MNRLLTWGLAALLVVGTVALAGSAGHQRTAPQRVSEQMDDGSNGSAPSGGFVSSVIGMEEASVDGTVAISRFETRFEAAPTDEARAAVLARSLNGTRMQVAMLEMRLRILESRRANGSISEDWFAIEVSWLRSQAVYRGKLAERLERAARTVPREDLGARNASVERIERLQERIDRLLATDAPAIHRTTFDRQFYREVALFVERFNESADASEAGALGDLLDGETVNLYIESTRGPPAVVSFRTTDTARIVDLRAGERANATVRMRMDEQTARRLLTADDPYRVLTAALVRGDVSTRGIGIGNGLKWGVRGIALGIVRALLDASEVIGNL